MCQKREVEDERFKEAGEVTGDSSSTEETVFLNKHAILQAFHMGGKEYEAGKAERHKKKKEKKEMQQELKTKKRGTVGDRQSSMTEQNRKLFISGLGGAGEMAPQGICIQG